MPYSQIEDFKKGFGKNIDTLDFVQGKPTFNASGGLFAKGKIFPYQNAIGFTLSYVLPKPKKSLLHYVDKFEKATRF